MDSVSGLHANPPLHWSLNDCSRSVWISINISWHAHWTVGDGNWWFQWMNGANSRDYRWHTSKEQLISIYATEFRSSFTWEDLHANQAVEHERENAFISVPNALSKVASLHASSPTQWIVQLADCPAGQIMVVLIHAFSPQDTLSDDAEVPSMMRSEQSSIVLAQMNCTVFGRAWKRKGESEIEMKLFTS